jgi:uncharacterized membrane protein YoaK (UPF0700 family)
MLGLAPDARHGPLPALLVILTVSTGLVDAVTFLRLGHVFVANMTGNVVFLAFALGGATEFSVPASSIALAAFLVGALAGGRMHRRLGAHRGRQLAVACTTQAVLAVGALTLSLWMEWRALDPRGTSAGYAMIALLGLAMGLQNATIRSIGVPGLTTTVLTSVLTGIAADWGGVPTIGTDRLRPLGVVVLFAGGALGAIVVLNRGVGPALGIVTVLLATTGFAAHLLSRGAPTWTSP